MLELDVVIRGSSPSPGIRTFSNGLTIKHRLRLVVVDLGYAAAAAPVIYLSLLVVQVVVGELDRVCGFVHTLLGRPQVICVW